MDKERERNASKYPVLITDTSDGPTRRSWLATFYRDQNEVEVDFVSIDQKELSLIEAKTAEDDPIIAKGFELADPLRAELLGARVRAGELARACFPILSNIAW